MGYETQECGFTSYMGRVIYNLRSLLKVQTYLPLPTDPTREKPAISPICTGREFHTFPDGIRDTRMRLYQLHGPRNFQFEIFTHTLTKHTGTNP